MIFGYDSSYGYHSHRRLASHIEVWRCSYRAYQLSQVRSLRQRGLREFVAILCPLKQRFYVDIGVLGRLIRVSGLLVICGFLFVENRGLIVIVILDVFVCATVAKATEGNFIVARVIDIILLVTFKFGSNRSRVLLLISADLKYRRRWVVV